MCLCLFFLSYFGCFPIGHKMVKSRITASRRLRAQVKKHQKTRRGGHNGFSPRLRELNSGDVPWEMPSGGKSKFPTHTHTHKKNERNVCGTQTFECHLLMSFSVISILFFHLSVIVTWRKKGDFLCGRKAGTVKDWSGCHVS